MWTGPTAKLVLLGLGCFAFAGIAANQGNAPASVKPSVEPPADTRQYTDDEVRTGFTRRAQLAFPIKVAVYERTTRTPGYALGDNEHAETVVKLLRDDTRHYQVVVLAPTFIQGDATPLALRRAAALHRADVMLLCESEFRVRVRPGPLALLAFLDLTGVAHFAVPDHAVEVESRVTAHLLDTRNGLIYHSLLKSQRWQGRLPLVLCQDGIEERCRELAMKNYAEVAADLRENLQHADRLAKEPAAEPVPYGKWSGVGKADPAPSPAPQQSAAAAPPAGVWYGTAPRQ